jgi:hypothetical protein
LKALRAVVLGGVVAVSACDPNVLIGARWNVGEAGSGGQMSAPGGASGGGGSSAGTAAGTAGQTEGGDMAVAGASPLGGDGGAAGEAPQPRWCVTAPWLNAPVVFKSENAGDDLVPAGDYVLEYQGGAQIHDGKIGYEVTGHYYGKNGILAGHHLFSGASPETGATHLWLDDTGLVSGGTVANVEVANYHHSWSFKHVNDGELSITLYDDVYEDNQGPGSRFCIAAAKP